MKKLNFSLRDLRRRLGWSRTQMANRLGCDVKSVDLWETKNQCPLDIFNREIYPLFSAVDENTDRLAIGPKAESVLEELSLSQIDLNRVG